ncbi:MAG: hypothetical protein KF749_01520 [Bacteroidetes bacterium]|nr:hypothetical protein [Bacteroidota bacterium]MCW5896193.1 hypothetical protein [Bacteroidota bacterium]
MPPRILEMDAGGGDNTVITNPGKEINAGDGKALDSAAIRAVGLNPLGMYWIRDGEEARHHQEEYDIVVHVYLLS